MCPGGLSRVAPDYFVTGEVRFLIRFPLDRRIVRQAGWESHCLRSPRGQSQLCQGRRIHARDIGDVIKVIELWQVSVLDAVLHPHVLMLVLVILIWFGEAHGWKPTFQEWLVIATPAVTITP